MSTPPTMSSRSLEDNPSGPPVPTPSDLLCSPPLASSPNHTPTPLAMSSLVQSPSRPPPPPTPAGIASSLPSQVVLARPHPGHKGWFIIITVSISDRGKTFGRKVLCVVDPQGSVPADAARIEDLLFVRVGRSRVSGSSHLSASQGPGKPSSSLRATKCLSKPALKC